MSTPTIDKQYRNRTPKRAGRGPWSRVEFLRYDEATNRIYYRHPTKGIRSRRFTEALFSQLTVRVPFVLPAHVDTSTTGMNLPASATA